MRRTAPSSASPTTRRDASFAEHAALFPLFYFVDRYHPARGEPGVPRAFKSKRAFGQATWRHALFGVVLGRLA